MYIFYSPLVYHFMLLCFSTWLINCFNADKYYLENDEWLNSSSLFLASFPAPHLNDCRPYPTSFLVLGSCCQLSSPLAHDCLICLHLLLAGFPSMKIPIPILTHQDPQPLWKTKLIPFHLPSPTADSPLLLTQTWVWHPRLVRLSTRPSCFLWKLVLFLLSFPSKSSSYFHISVKSECEWWLVQLLKLNFVETLFESDLLTNLIIVDIKFWMLTAFISYSGPEECCLKALHSHPSGLLSNCFFEA